MRTFVYSLFILLAVSTVLNGCVRDTGSPARDKSLPIDSLVRSMASSVYAAPDSVAAQSRALLAEPLDSVDHHYITTMLAFSSILLGDRQLYDSLTDATARFTLSHPEESSLNEFFHRNRAVVFNLMGLNDSAYIHMTLARDAAIASGNSHFAVEDEAALGDLAEALGELPLATAHMRRAVAMADSVEYNGSRSFAVSLGALYSAMGNFDEADRYFTLHRNRIDSYPPFINFFFYSSLGNSFYYRNSYSEAADCFRNALSLARIISDVSLEAMTEVNLGECLLYSGQTDSAAFYIDNGVERFRRIGVQDKTQRAYMESLLGDLAMRRGDFAAAARLLGKTDTLSLPPKYRMLHYNRTVDLLSRMGDYRNALHYRDKAIEIERRLHHIDTRNYAAELENRYMYDTTMLNAKVMIGHKEEEVLRLRQWIYLGIAIAVVIIAAVGAVALYNANRRRKALAKMQQSLMGLRLDSTRNRMAPHFIFNVLNAELDMRGNQAVMRLINLIRRNLELAERPVVSLGEELQFIREYIDVKRSSIEPDFEFRLDVAPEVNTDRMIPSMMVELFVENAIKHGLTGFPGRKLLEVEVTSTGGATCIRIINNGRMVSPAEAKGTGTGMRIVAQTIHTLNVVNQRPVTLTHTIMDCPEVDGGKCYVVTIIIPDNYDFSPLTK